MHEVFEIAMDLVGCFSGEELREFGVREGEMRGYVALEELKVEFVEGLHGEGHYSAGRHFKINNIEATAAAASPLLSL